MIGKSSGHAGSARRRRSVSPVVITCATGLPRKSGVSNSPKRPSETSTSAPGRQINRRATICGCKVLTDTAARHSGMPQQKRRSHNWASTCCGWAAERAPSTSHSATALVSPAFIETKFIAIASALIVAKCAFAEQHDGDRCQPIDGRARSCATTNGEAAEVFIALDRSLFHADSRYCSQ